METRSSPSLEQLHGLARQADITDEYILSLSKPALFRHLRSNYDYNRLERAHGTNLKIGEDDGGSSSNSIIKIGHSDDTNPAAPWNKRSCRASRGGGSSSRAASHEHQNLPPASIFVQTRSRTRMLAARDGGGGSGGGGAESSAIGPEAAPPPLGQVRTTATARQRTRRLPASGRESSSRGKVAASTSTNNGGGGSVSGVDPKRPSSAEASGSMIDRRPERGGGGGGGSKGKGKAKVKAKANGSGKGIVNSRGRARNSRGAQVSSARANRSGSRERGEGKDDDSGRPNALDPIMLVEVGEHHYRFVRPNGRNVMYNLDSLVDYFISTGDFLEPETRLPFSDDELRAIDVKEPHRAMDAEAKKSSGLPLNNTGVKAAGLSKPSVLEAKRDPSRYAEQKFQQDALVGLERMLSELVTSMLKVVEELDREEGEIRLVMEIFPPFADLFKQIWAADRAFARQCMQHYTSWLQGPPNRPTEDEMGFLDIIVGFLNQLQECEGTSSLGF